MSNVVLSSRFALTVSGFSGRFVHAFGVHSPENDGRAWNER
jgi:hypothetical protein